MQTFVITLYPLNIFQSPREYTEHERRQLLIARLPNVETLNGGGVISSQEREDAERAFIRYYMDKPEADRPERWVLTFRTWTVYTIRQRVLYLELEMRFLHECNLSSLRFQLCSRLINSILVSWSRSLAMLLPCASKTQLDPLLRFSGIPNSWLFTESWTPWWMLT